MFRRSLAWLAIAASAAILSTCAPRVDQLAQVQTLGTLRVATINSASTYYLGKNGPTGFEYDLAHRFADALGVKLQMLVLPNRRAVVDAIASGRAQMAAGLAISAPRRQLLRFTPPYTDLKMKVVYRHGEDKPKQLADLSGHLTLPGNSAIADWMRRQHPDVRFATDPDANTEELMDQVAKGKLDATIANADLVAMNQRYYPILRVAFDVPDMRQRAAWAFARPRRAGHDDKLYNKAIAFIEQSRDNGTLHILRDRFFGHAAQLGFVGGAEFAKQVKQRLGKWQAYFKQTAKKYGLDWRLLAAIGYQESRWNQHAVSPTTVRGIMMLTRSTAKRVNVDDRRDPKQSINGGARYLLDLRKRLPAAVHEPDRTWFAIAAYNIGLGHVMDARRLLADRDRNPNLWINLRDALPWLSQKHYLSKTKYGYAHGLQAAAYVSNIRAYYDILVWMTDKTHTKKPAALDKQPSSAGVDDSNDNAPATISIDSPAF